MPFPSKLLIPGEEIVVESHPNWSVLVRPVSAFVLVLGACVAVAVAWSSAPIWVLYVLAAVAAVAAVFLAARVVSYRSKLLVITTSRVIYRSGVIRRTGREIPLDRIQDVTYHQSLVERLARAGSLTIESAGAAGQEPFPDIRRPAEMQSLINQLVSGDRDRFRGPPPGRPVRSHRDEEPATSELPVVGSSTGRTPPAPEGQSLAEALRELERLHELGVITDAEFAVERRRLLGLD